MRYYKKAVDFVDCNKPEGISKVLSEIERDADIMPATSAGEETSLLDLLIVIVGRRWLIVKMSLGMLLVGVLFCLLWPNSYTASTAILPPQQGGSAGSALLSQLGNLGSVASLAGGSLGLKNPNDLQIGILKSRTIEDAMVDRFHLLDLFKTKRRSAARRRLESRVDIQSGVKDGLIRISVTDKDPNLAADMANGYVDEYKKASARLAVSEASQRRLFFEQQLAAAKDNLANAEEELKKTEQQTGLIQLDSQARAVIGSVAQLRAQIAAKEVQIQAQRSFATGENPDLQVAEQELAGLKTQLEKTGASSEEMLIPHGNLQQSGLEYVRKLRDVKYFETIFDLLARQYEVAKVDEARQGALVQVVDQAVVPDKRSWPRPSIILPISLVLGIIVGIGWAFGAEALKRLKNNPAERTRLETLSRLFSSKGRQTAL